MSVGLAQRARIVLLAADGARNKDIAEQLGEPQRQHGILALKQRAAALGFQLNPVATTA
jgi:hypothetical protein